MTSLSRQKGQKSEDVRQRMPKECQKNAKSRTKKCLMLKTCLASPSPPRRGRRHGQTIGRPIGRLGKGGGMEVGSPPLSRPPNIAPSCDLNEKPHELRRCQSWSFFTAHLSEFSHLVSGNTESPFCTPILLSSPTKLQPQSLFPTKCIEHSKVEI